MISHSVIKRDRGMIYGWAKTLFKAPSRIEARTQANMLPETDSFAKLRNGVRKFTGNRLKELADYDYREFPRLALGKFRCSLAEPPRGAMLLLLYPGTVGPRLYRAYQRGKENNDYREMGDVLRRDLTAITLIMFALNPVIKGLSSLMQKASGVHLLDPKAKSVLKYSQFNSYKIDHPEILKAILMEGNGKALKDAVNSLDDRGLLARFGEENLAGAIKGIKDSVSNLVERFDKLTEAHPGVQKEWPQEIKDDFVKEVYQKFQDAEKLRKGAFDQAKAGGSAEMAKIAEKMKGEFTGVLQNYAKARRLPVDLASFAILVGAIGYLPMWFNTQWNERQFKKKMDAKADAEQKSTQPAASPFTPLSAPTSFGLNSPFRSPLAFQSQPVGFQQGIVAQNPFQKMG